MDVSPKDATVHTLAEVALAALASTGPLGAAASTVISKVLERWHPPSKSDYEQALATEVEKLKKELELDDNAMQMALGQAQAALADHGLSAWELAGLGFNAKNAAAEIAERSGYHAIQDPDGPARRVLTKAIELLPEDPRQHRRLEAAFREVVLELLKSQDQQLRQQAEFLGGVALLEMPGQPWRKRPTPAQLLDPAAGILPYHPRPKEDKDLEAWLESDEEIALRIYAAEGGSGKTRFMLEHCRRRLEQGWQAGFLTAHSMQLPNPKALYRNLFTTDRPTLVVVDYVEGRSEQLGLLLEALHQAPDDIEARIVLLTRRTEGHWQEGLESGEEKRVADLLREYPLDPHELDPLLISEDERLEFFNQVFEAFSHHLDKATRKPSKSDPPPLNESHFELPLFVAMAALVHLLGDGKEESEEQLLERLLEHERRLWKRDKLETEAVEQAMASITLWQGATFDRVGRLPGYWPVGSKLHEATASTLSEHLKSLYGDPDDDERIQPLRPDRLGEHLICQALNKWPRQLAQGAYPNDLDKDTLAQSFLVLSRLRPHCWTQESHAFIKALETRLQTTNDLQFVERFESALPHQTVNLTPLAVAATQRLYETLKLDDDAPIEAQAEKARLANNLANRLLTLGHRAEALEPAQEAAMLYRQLAQKQPDAFLPNLAISLNNLATFLSKLGRREEALKPAQEAAKLYRQFVLKQPDAFLPDLAGSLNNLAIRLSELSRQEEALELALEAAKLYRQLAQKQPGAFLPDLALSLNNLAIRLSELGRREEALESALKAVEIRRQLAHKQPDAFLPDLALSLNNLAIRLSELGRQKEALEPAQKSVKIRRQLVQKQPDAFLPNLAVSLNSLAIFLSKLGRREEALKPAQEAAKLYQQLAQKQPDAFLPDLALSLNNLAIRLSELGRQEEALEPALEAAKLYRQLAQKQPDAFSPNLATSLNNLANRLSELGRREEALEPALEAVEIRRQLVQKQPDAFLPDLAASLNNLGLFLSELGRQEEALEPALEAVEIRRQLAQKQPDAFLPDLVGSLNNLANRLSELGRREEALEPAQEAVEIHRQLAQKQPDAFLPDLATSLNNLANRLSELGRREEALEPALEAVKLYRQLALKQPDAFLPDLAASLNNLANRLSELGHREEALEPAQEAATLYRQLALKQPDAFSPNLATSLNNLANRLSELGRQEEALEPALEAVEIRRQLAQKQPDAFLPDLARSLGTYGMILLEDDPSASAAAFTEGIEALLPAFSRYPSAFTALIGALTRGYLDALEKSGAQPDEALLKQVNEVFEQLPTEE